MRKKLVLLWAALCIVVTGSLVFATAYSQDDNTHQIYGFPVKLTDGTDEVAIGSDGGLSIAPVDLATAAATHYAITCTSANTQYSQALTNVKRLRFQCRTSYDVRYAFVTGKVATPTDPYHTLKSGSYFAEEGLNIASMTLFVASAQAGVVVEVEVW